MTTPTQLVDDALAAQDKHTFSCSRKDWEACNSTRQALIDALTPTPIPRGVFLLAATGLSFTYRELTPSQRAKQDIDTWADFTTLVTPYADSLTDGKALGAAFSEALAYLTLEYNK